MDKNKKARGNECKTESKTRKREKVFAPVGFFVQRPQHCYGMDTDKLNRSNAA